MDIDLLEIAANYEELAKRKRKDADAMHPFGVGARLQAERYAECDKLEADAKRFREMAGKG